MALKQLKFMALKEPLFVGGRTFGMLVDAHEHPELLMQHNSENDHVEVTYNGEIHEVWPSNIKATTAGTVAKPKVEPLPLGLRQRKIKAQVSTPTSHVFDEGPGKTNR